MMIRSALILLQAFCLTEMCIAQNATPFRMTVMYRNLAYTSTGNERQRLDLYLPSPPVVRVRARPPVEGYKEKLPLIIFIHGGGFFAGSKDLQAPVEFAELGYAVASIDYRLSGEAKFPAQIEDCKAAVRWLRANAAKYALDPDRFVVWGESAGGFLGAMLGTTSDVKEFEVGENLDRSSRVSAVVDMYGPTDFAQNSFAIVNDKTPEAQLIGGAVLENKEKAARANPITYVTKNAPPFLIVHGDADKLVPHQQSELLYTALKKENIPVTFYTVKGGDHGNFDDPKVRELVTEFLAKYFSKPAKH